MLVQLVHIQVKPDRIEDFLDAFRINYEGTIKEPGNLRFDVLQDPNDETRFSIYEVFVDEAAVDAHRNTPHYATTVALLDDIMTGPRSKDFYRMMMSNLTEARE
ncbi:MAG: antibiotic biosynthesis monooxygenase [Hoeflea sp.]|uniref:antibiotic biosynthesis monooxygenase n=1 Tax=Hoeflea sp. TaxID=1940281 RepID=UPI001D9A9363|nr:antibiotic biosynthesis monooxygenase [Hoeflea sp.]MBU4531945.1 antibiotic biosynthesis monooxygenase [Alphaproteobacteria bacterium]MBU4546367.1 antibiotic biosynthesis monooxygenase [Alphaproteobacteria bacterium]MBU4549496.1 antibiotic biosynthesis monooxygenase [Alphaproteobacteria bacterium]MBV1722671.1 antibiotic biosynthesis monooxygenase [Hoeflea sp.]MBV1782609.1 antibiotic biosynthesis monooxygenase [Hoeflea sp.]